MENVSTSSWASLVAQMVKNLPAMQKTQVRFLGRKDPLEKEMTTHSSILTCRILWTDSCSHKELDTTKQLTLPHPSMSKMQHSVSPSASNAEKDTDAHSPWWYLHNIAVTQSLLLHFHILHSRDVFLKLLFFFWNGVNRVTTRERE